MTPSSRDACLPVLEQLDAYLDGEASAPACEAVEAHCRECPACRDTLRGLQATAGLCRQAAEEPLPPAVRARARASIAALLQGARDADPASGEG